MGEKIVEIKGLNCVSGNRYLLQNINWTIERGEHWLLFGNNGCGKTTLLSVLSGYKDFDSGSVKVFDQSYTAENVLTLRKKIGWVSSSFFDKYYHQERALDIVLSSLSGGLGKGFAISNAELVRARELMEELNLADKIERPFDLLSKGERQNVLIARALLTEPELLILDEPGTGLDVFARAHMLERVEQMARHQHMTIIYVTHYPEEILPLFEKCLLMTKGTIYCTGPTAELFNEKVLSGFIEAPVNVTYEQGKYYLTLEQKGGEG